MYERGQGVPQDYSEAMRLYKGAAERGDAAAQYRAATCTAEASASSATTPRR